MAIISSFERDPIVNQGSPHQLKTAHTSIVTLRREPIFDF